MPTARPIAIPSAILAVVLDFISIPPVNAQFPADEIEHRDIIEISKPTSASRVRCAEPRAICLRCMALGEKF